MLENYLELIDKKIIKPMIFVVADSGFDRQSWYSNFYKDNDHKYENYITDTLYNEVKKISPNGKIGIAGFSMGGYAALKIGLKYIEKFDVIGSFSGAVSIIRMSKISPNGKIGIAGFSMGGYAALKIGLKYIEKFDVIGSFSGAVSIIRMSLNRRVLRLMRYLYIRT